MQRKVTRQIHVGPVAVGGDAPVVVQSMTSTPTGDEKATLDQIVRLAAAGCEIVRVSLAAAADEEAFAHVIEHSPLPVVADIHFDYRLALSALELGAAGVRINPGTIGPERVVRQIVEAAGERGAAIRIGVNSGSLPRPLRELARTQPVEALVRAATGFAERFEEWGFAAFKISVKSSSVPDTIAAYRLLSERTDAPLHVGVTEAGTVWSGTVKSAAGIGALLADGIGDTLRVSLTGDPVEEVRVAWAILAALEVRRRGPNLISCPTCGRTELDLAALAAEVERRLQRYTAPISVAVMGCRVNGPEEARQADFGIAGGKGEGVVFARGEKVATVPENRLVAALFAEIDGALRRGDVPANVSDETGADARDETRTGTVVASPGEGE
jgi:(E)-4-hydroxy-3-methylbut-2-enyl-diphosphate synthase